MVAPQICIAMIVVVKPRFFCQAAISKLRDKSIQSIKSPKKAAMQNPAAAFAQPLHAAVGWAEYEVLNVK